ncbi:MAG: hypothetical protein HUU01_20995 [Saprospiraceae bacterium]|nr:hypothetical protein [Saprospiraceae bacterium]
MELMLNQKMLPVILLGLLLVISIWWMQPLSAELSNAPVLSMTPWESWEEMVQEPAEESPAGASNGEPPRQNRLQDEIERAKGHLSKNDYKAAKSNYRKMLEHIEKLKKYKQDPLKFDNQGLLKNAPSEQIRQKIIDARVAHLEQEIQTFYHNILKIINH